MRDADNIDLELIERLHRYFPFVEREAEDYIQTSDFEIMVVLKNGSKILYDDIHHSFRNLPDNCNDLTEMQFRKEFSERLWRIMGWRNISQVELSERTGISQVQISKYMSCKATPSFYTIDKIAKALDCSVEEFRYV